jgi:hypothetical protein
MTALTQLIYRVSDTIDELLKNYDFYLFTSFHMKMEKVDCSVCTGRYIYNDERAIVDVYPTNVYCTS